MLTTDVWVLVEVLQDIRRRALLFFETVEGIDMAIKASYQQIREQLINLSVDLEDKTNVCKILEQKAKDERHLLGLVESEYEARYQIIVEVRSIRVLISVIIYIDRQKILISIIDD